MVSAGTKSKPELSERIRSLRLMTVKAEPELCAERATIITKAYQDNEDKQINTKRALALARVLDEMSIFILDGELIVGNHASKLKAAPVFPEFATDYIERELPEIPDRAGDRFSISNGVRQALLEIFPYWKGRTVKDRVMSMLTDELIKGGQGYVSAFDNEWTLENGDGHIAIDYPKLLRIGLNAIIAQVRAKIDTLDLAEPEHFSRYYFYQSLLIVYEAAIRFANRFADLSEQMAAAAENPGRKTELLEIARICRRVPADPAGSFREALQSIWFVQLIIQIETNGHSISIGRFDQFMYPYFVEDIKSGRATRWEIFEILNCFWIKLASITKLRSYGPTKYTAGFPMFQNLTIGGQGPNGDDVTNELSFMILDCHDQVRLSQPTLTVRVHKATASEFLRRCVEVLAGGGGMPSFFNDEIIIPSLLLRGITKEDAYNYCLVGCVEPSVAGKWGGRQGAAQFHLTKCLEMAMNGGRDPRTGIKLCGNGQTFLDFESVDELKQAFKEQVSYYIRLYAIKDNIQDLAWEEMIPTPFVSGLVDDCIERGKELKKGGAVYDFSAGQTGNIANVANSIAAIQKLVFEEKRISKTDLWTALQANFESADGEAIRQILINKAPKYGNDDDYVDSIAKEAFSHYLNEVGKYKNTRYGRGPIGCTYHPSTASVSYNIPAGELVGATPDGRKSGEPLADVESPFHGTELKGPTAVIKSVSKLEHILESGGSILNLKFNPSIFQDGRNLDNVVALIRTYFELKGMEIQIDIVSSKKLREAQKRPQQYADLLVRVAGYSAYFVGLDPDVQNDIIARTEHQGF
jgi:pyruvate formate-lyase/glycerol dehydratase family glycyl radical enzyme